MAISRRTLNILGFVLTAIVVGAFAVHALSMIQRDGINATYRNYRGALMHYSGVLVVVVVGIICALGAFAYAWWHRRRQRREETELAAQIKEDEPGRLHP